VDADVIAEIRDKVQPALRELIALASERGLSALSVAGDGMQLEIRRGHGPAPVATPAVDKPTGIEELHESSLVPVRSTLVGVFRRGPLGQSLKIGDNVESDQVLAYVESMKLMHEVKAPQAGQLAEILVEEGHPVEYGQPLMVLVGN
jgi:acetyl-CoA carboxylase biotin carboxyl carrier protein